MKKKTITTIVFIVLVLISIPLYKYSKFYFYLGEKGVRDGDKLHLATGMESSYQNNVFLKLSTIANNDNYGTFVFKADGKFYYFPENNNILDINNKNIYKYMGYWFYDMGDMKFTVLRTYFNKSIFDVSFEKKDYIISLMNISNEKTPYVYKDNLLIDNQEFELLNNELTDYGDEGLRLNDKRINEYLKTK